MGKIFLIIATAVLALSTSGCGPEEGSKDWCENMKTKKESDFSIHDKEVFVKNCIRLPGLGGVN